MKTYRGGKYKRDLADFPAHIKAGAGFSKPPGSITTAAGDVRALYDQRPTASPGQPVMALPEAFKLRIAHRGLRMLDRAGQDALWRDFASATVFDFDDAVSIAVGKLSIDMLPQLGKLLPDIRLPTKSLLLTLRYKALLQTIYNARETEFGKPLVVEEDCPEECMFAVRQVHPELPIFDIIHATPDIDGSNAFLVPLIYRFDAHSHSANDQVLFSGHLASPETEKFLLEWVDMLAHPTSSDLPPSQNETYGWRFALRAYHLIGSGLTKQVLSREAIECLRGILYRTSVRYLPGADRTHVNAICADADFIKEFAGTARVAIASLALLSMRDSEIIEVLEAKRRTGLARLGSKTTPYYKHSTVSLLVPSTRYEYLVKKHAEKAARRRHHVIGHWANHGGKRHCDHTWIDVDVDHKQCSTCGRKRYWRREHDRGNAELGWVIHDRYAVHSSGEEVK